MLYKNSTFASFIDRGFPTTLLNKRRFVASLSSFEGGRRRSPAGGHSRASCSDSCSSSPSTKACRCYCSEHFVGQYLSVSQPLAIPQHPPLPLSKSNRCSQSPIPDSAAELAKDKGKGKSNEMLFDEPAHERPRPNQKAKG